MTDERIHPEPMTHWDPPEVLAYRNRKLLADRLHWPDGVLETCERLDEEFPGWSFAWLNRNDIPGFERPAVYQAHRRMDRHHSETTLYRADLDELLRIVGSYEPYEPFPPYRYED